MKFNKWTLGLAALGVVSLASAAKAVDEAKTYLETAVSQTQISGYVNTSAHWNFNGNTRNLDSLFSTKSGGFNMDAAEITIAKPLDETEWAAGYTVQLVYGQDAGTVGVGLGATSASSTSTGTNAVSTSLSGFTGAIKQAYVELRAPVGNGIDIKVGIWDTLLGYEVFDAGSNPNYTRSYGYLLEPTTYTGILASYKFCDVVSASAGIANTANVPNGRASVDSRKAYLASLSLTAPQSWGVLAGSSLYGAVSYGQQSGVSQNQINYYAGTVINTGVKGLKVGASYDYFGLDTGTSSGQGTAWADAIAVYASFQATDKLSFHARGEYAWVSGGTLNSFGFAGAPAESAYALTGTVQYDLWKNVMSRVEMRWDHIKDGALTSSANKDSVLLAANLIYKF